MQLSADASLPSAPPRRLLIATLLASVAYGLLAMTACLPSMPSWAELFGVGLVPRQDARCMSVMMLLFMSISLGMQLRVMRLRRASDVTA